jgi:hypothetical protein
LIEAIKLDCRVDARSAKETRLLRSAELAAKGSKSKQSHVLVDQVRFGSENGQVLVKLGQTKVLTQSHLKIVCPRAGKPNEGELKIKVEFSSLNHSAEFN